MQNEKSPILFWAVPIVMVLVANLKMPYGYYTLMKIIISGSCFLGALEEYKRGESKSQLWFVITIFFLILYNPIIKISLGRSLWSIINILTIALYVAHYFYFFKKKVQIQYDKIL